MVSKHGKFKYKIVPLIKRLLNQVNMWHHSLNIIPKTDMFYIHLL